MTDEVSTLGPVAKHAYRFTMAYAAGANFLTLARGIRRRWDASHSYTVTVEDDDPVYPFIHAWLIDVLPVEEHRSLKVRSSLDRGVFIESNEEAEASRARPNLIVTYSGTKVHSVVIEGHEVKVQVMRPGEKEQPVVPGQLEAKKSSRYDEPDSIVFTAKDSQGQRVIWQHLDRIVGERRSLKYRPALYMLTPWGEWRRRADLPTRSMASVILRAGLKESLVEDLERFLASEEQYGRLGIPWHRGYLLHGPPGTGKTSIVKALAEHFGLDIWYAPLGDLSKDSNLLNLVREVRPKSILLLEDAGIFMASQDRDSHGPTASTQNQISLSGLLNALDGVATPHGLITFMTDNDISHFDPALIRSGRMDVVEKIEMPTANQFERLFNWFYDRPPSRPISPKGSSMADLMEVLRTSTWLEVEQRYRVDRSA